MKRARIKIAVRNGYEWRPCIARRNGIAITRAPRGEKGWTITHMATGRHINRLSLLSLPAARTAFALASSLGPWDGFAADVEPPAHVLEALRAISEMAEAE